MSELRENNGIRENLLIKRGQTCILPEVEIWQLKLLKFKTSYVNTLTTSKHLLKTSLISPDIMS